MFIFKQKANLGLNELWAVAYQDFQPYKDRMRSTNADQYRNTSMLEVKIPAFKPDTTFIKRKK
jgi:hypothetical protein